jgi:hypothetical protein
VVSAALDAGFARVVVDAVAQRTETQRKAG